MLHTKTACNQLTQHPSSTSFLHQSRAPNANFMQCHKTVIRFYPFLNCNSFVVVIVLKGILLSAQIFMLNTQLLTALLKHSCSIHSYVQLHLKFANTSEFLWFFLDYLSQTHNPEMLTLGKSLFLSSLSIFVKVNSSPCLIKHQAMKIHGGRRVPHTFLTLASEKGECLTPHSEAVSLGETASGTYWTGRCVVRDQVFNTLGKMKTLPICPCWQSNPNMSVIQLVAMSLWFDPYHMEFINNVNFQSSIWATHELWTNIHHHRHTFI